MYIGFETIRKTDTGGSVALSDTRRFASALFLQLDSMSFGTAYIGGEEMDDTDATSLAETCLFSLTGGQVIQMPMSMLDQKHHEQIDLSKIFVWVDAANNLRAVFPVRVSD